MVTEDAKCTMQHADDALQNYVLKTYVILLTNITPKSSMKNTGKQTQYSFILPLTDK